MKVTAYSNNLFQLTRLGFVNCYLVRENDGFTLIDTGMSGQAQPIVQAAQKLGLPIVRIVLTHAHVDHVGSLDALHEALPNAQVAISERDARFLSGDQSLDPTEPQVPLRGGYPVCTTKPTLLLHEGDRIGSLEVIATPGHTPFTGRFLLMQPPEKAKEPHRMTEELTVAFWPSRTSCETASSWARVRE